MDFYGAGAIQAIAYGKGWKGVIVDALVEIGVSVIPGAVGDKFVKDTGGTLCGRKIDRSNTVIKKSGVGVFCGAPCSIAVEIDADALDVTG